MKILFTILAIDAGNDNYLISAKNLINEILEQTNHDILVSTNSTSFFDEQQNNRLTIRNNIDEKSILKFNGEFNYNLKFNAFENIPSTYDCIIYIDCDIKLNGWNNNSEKFLEENIQKFNFGADRLNCVLLDEISYYLNNKPCLFKHKITAYDILNQYDLTDPLLLAKLPSEHILIFRNEQDKIIKFHKKWCELNFKLESLNGGNGAWGDGFEIGISAKYAGLDNYIDIGAGIWDGLFGFKFNGNKL